MPTSWTMTLREDQVRLLVLLVLTSTAAVGVVFLTAVCSICVVYALKTFFGYIIQLVSFVAELIIAVVAAITSGATVTLSIIAAAAAAAMTFPASSIQGRVSVAAAVSSSAIVASAAAVLTLATLRVDAEVAAALVSAAAMSVALAAAWAVGVMSLIEKETRHVGLKMTSILDSVRHNNFRILKLLLKLHTGLKQRDVDVALIHAVKAGYQQCAEVLLASGANPDARDSYDNTPLSLACETGSERLVEVLLGAGAVIDLRNGARGTALHQAAKWGYAGCIRLLLERKANPNVQDGLWRTPVMLAATHAHDSGEVLRMLVDAGADVTIVASEGQTALHFLAVRGLDPEVLLAAGADPNVGDSQHNTALHSAAAHGHYTVVRRLLAAGCNPSALNFQRRGPLHLAAIKGDVASLQALVDAGANTQSVDASGNLPVWYTASYGQYDATVFFVRRNCALFCELCAEAPHHTPHVSNPLIGALEHRHMTIARVLLIGGCDAGPLAEWLLGIVPSAWSEDHAEHLQWLQHWVQNPRDLAHQCRLTVRRVLGTSIASTAHCLPLPKPLQEFVLMSDL